MLTGRPPFDGDGVGEIIVGAPARGAAARRARSRPGFPPALDALVLRCLAKDPGDRFQSMAELQQACEAQLARITGGGAPTIALANLPTVVAPGAQTTMRGAAGQVTPVPGRPRRGVWLGVATVVLAAAAIAVVALRGGSKDEAPGGRRLRRAVVSIDAGGGRAMHPHRDAPPPRCRRAGRRAGRCRAVAAAPFCPSRDAVPTLPIRARRRRDTPTRPAEDPYDIR